MKNNQSMRALIFGGLIPVIAFTAAEHYLGILWGLIIGMVFGLGEILFEWFRHKKVDGMTWFGSGLILVLGGVALVTQEGIWFKLQPALLEAAMGVLLLGSVLIKKPLLIVMASKQKLFEKMDLKVRPFMEYHFKWITTRLSLFFFAHTVLAVYAALYWTTSQWALLKGVGFTVSMLVYLAIEVTWLRRRIRKYVEIK